MKTCEIKIIGSIDSPVEEPVDEGWGDLISRVVLLPEYRAGLLGLEGFSHVVVVTFLHRAVFDASTHLVRRPRGLASMPEVGIFAQRAKDRPNPLGISVVHLLEVQSDSVVVQGLDAIHGTPVVDLKPYFPQYDDAPGATVPEWVERLMKGYFREDKD